MGQAIRQSIFTSVVSYAGVVIGYVNLLYLYPRFLEPEQIGLLRTIVDAALLLAPFAQGGLAQTILRFLPHFTTYQDKGHGFVNLILLLSLCGYGIFLLLILAFREPLMSFYSDNAATIANYTTLILVLTFIVMVMTLLEYYSRALMKLVFPSLVREVCLRLLQALLVTLYFLGTINFEQVLTGTVVIYLVALASLIIYLAAGGHLGSGLTFRSLTAPRKREIFSYSALSLVTSGSMILIGKLDSQMVAALAGYAANAIYTTAFYMATVIEIPKRAISQTSATLIARAFATHNMSEVRTIYQKSALNQYIIGALLLIGVWANLDNIFTIMPKGEVFGTGASVVVWVGLAKLLDMAFGPNSEVIVMSRYYWFNMVTLVLLAILVIISNAYLIPEYGIIGAAYATAISLTLFNLLKWIFVWLTLRIQPFTPAFVVVTIIAASVTFLNTWLPSASNVVVDIMYRSAVISIVYGGLILITRSSEEVEKVVLGVWRRIVAVIGKK
ncbi:MAG: polysaccharide biosynthesis C-terminal domain-containing protein [Bacteroidota bacterium]|jgi:O-antigen/teichoic acid export membrane protein